MDVTEAVYNTDGFNYVSIIQQCYNLRGKNKGKYSGIKLDGIVTEDDIRAFVNKNPDGIRDSIKPGTGIELETFLRDRIARRDHSCEDTNKSDFYQFDEDAYKSENIGNEIKEIFNGSFRSKKSTSQKTTFGQYTNTEKQTGSDHETSGAVIGIVLVIVLLVILAIVFNWFGIRTKLAVLLINVLMYAWIFGLLIFLIMIIFDKVSVMSGKSFISKAITFVVVGVATFIILVFVLDILARIK